MVSFAWFVRGVKKKHHIKNPLCIFRPLNIGHHDFVKDGDKVISLSTKELREKYKDYERIKEKKISLTLKQRYRIPPKLIEELFELIPME